MVALEGYPYIPMFFFAGWESQIKLIGKVSFKERIHVHVVKLWEFSMSYTPWSLTWFTWESAPGEGDSELGNHRFQVLC